MRYRMGMFVITLCACSITAEAQHATVAPVNTAPAEARQFNFMIGQWDLEVRPAASTLATRIHGVPKLTGTWRAWRALDGYGIEDELQITDMAGNPATTAHTVRFYDAEQKRWKTSVIDVYRAQFSTATGVWKDDAMTFTSHGNDATGRSYATRTRFFDITPASFRFRQERSYDEGKTWDTSLSIDAKRVAAAAAR